MRKSNSFLARVSLLVAAATMTVPAHAAQVWATFGGRGGEFDAPSWSLGFRGNNNWGLSIGGASVATYGNVLDYPVPHNNYRTIDEEAYVSNPIGAEVLYFSDHDWVSLYLGAGAYAAERCEIAQSRATGWLYCQREVNSAIGAGSLGVIFGRHALRAGAEFSSARGAGFTLSYGW